VLLHQFNHTTTGYYPRSLRRYKFFYSCQGFLDHTPTVWQGQKLFRETWSAEWPESRTASTCQNDRIEMFHIYYNSLNINLHQTQVFLASNLCAIQELYRAYCFVSNAYAHTFAFRYTTSDVASFASPKTPIIPWSEILLVSLTGPSTCTPFTNKSKLKPFTLIASVLT